MKITIFNLFCLTQSLGYLSQKEMPSRLALRIGLWQAQNASLAEFAVSTATKWFSERDAKGEQELVAEALVDESLQTEVEVTELRILQEDFEKIAEVTLGHVQPVLKYVINGDEDPVIEG